MDKEPLCLSDFLFKVEKLPEFSSANLLLQLSWENKTLAISMYWNTEITSFTLSCLEATLLDLNCWQELPPFLDYCKSWKSRNRVAEKSLWAKRLLRDYTSIWNPVLCHFALTSSVYLFIVSLWLNSSLQIDFSMECRQGQPIMSKPRYPS